MVGIIIVNWKEVEIYEEEIGYYFINGIVIGACGMWEWWHNDG